MKRALLVGVDAYDRFNPLAGCVNDVAALHPLLARDEDGTPNFDCRVLVSDHGRVTRDRLVDEIDLLLAPGVDVALLYFAGHGAPHDHDVSLVTTDGTNTTPGVRFSDVLARAQSSSVGEIVVLLDCCFSGGTGVPQFGTSSTSLRSGLSMLTASRGDQTSAETSDRRGLFSSYLEGALEGGAADVVGKVTLAGIYAYLTESFGAWQQRPTLKANVDRLHDLRRCSPAVPLEQLRRLPELFAAPGTVLPLDPSYEPDAEPAHAEHERDFALLQRCRAAKLVEPIDADHLYFAAMESKGCRLTPLGRHYRDLAERGRL